MKPERFSITPQTDADGICQAQAASSGGIQLLTLNGALVTSGVATLNDADHIVTITSGANNSGITFTITGKDYRGYEYTEVVTGPNSNTVSSSNYYRSISSISVSGDTTSTVTVGVNGVSISKVIPLDVYQDSFRVGFNVEVPASPSPSLTYSVQHTSDDVQVKTNLNDLAWNNHDSINAKTGTEDGSYTIPVIAMRVSITAYATGTMNVTVIQEG